MLLAVYALNFSQAPVARILAQMVFGANGSSGFEASHRCNDNRCVRPSHFLFETRAVNGSRSTCTLADCMHALPCLFHQSQFPVSFSLHFRCPFEVIMSVRSLRKRISVTKRSGQEYKRTCKNETNQIGRVMSTV